MSSKVFKLGDFVENARAPEPVLVGRVIGFDVAPQLMVQWLNGVVDSHKADDLMEARRSSIIEAARRTSHQKSVSDPLAIVRRKIRREESTLDYSYSR